MVGHSVPKANLRVLDHLIGARHELAQVRPATNFILSCRVPGHICTVLLNLCFQESVGEVLAFCSFSFFLFSSLSKHQAHLT